jgi:ankyrin repeat protein
VSLVLCLAALPALADGSIGNFARDASISTSRAGGQDVAVLGHPRLPLAESITERHPDVAPEWQFRASPLHAAALNDDAAAVKRLVEIGFDADARDRFGKTPLMVASAFGNTGAAAALLDLGADMAARDKELGATALHYAARAGHVGEPTARFLLARGAEPGVKTAEGATPLHLAALFNHARMIGVLVDGGAAIDAVDSGGVTALQYARRSGRLSAVDALLRLGARVDGLNDAVNAGDLRRVRELIAAGAPVNRRELTGTALHLAVAKGNAAIVAALVDAGADLEAEGDPGEARPLHLAAIVDQPDVARLLIERGAALEARDAEGRTPLMVAAAFATNDIGALLLRAGADIEAVDTLGRAPIHHAAMSGDADLILMLLARGVDVDVRSGNAQMTPLHFAAGFSDLSAILVLASHGADLDVRDRTGSNAFDHASRCRAMLALDLLRKLAAK